MQQNPMWAQVSSTKPSSSSSLLYNLPVQLELLHGADKHVERTHQCSMLHSEYHTRVRLTFALCLYDSVRYSLLQGFLDQPACMQARCAAFVSRISSWGLSGKEAWLCECEERGASLTLTSCVNFPNLIHYHLQALRHQHLLDKNLVLSNLVANPKILVDSG